MMTKSKKRGGKVKIKRITVNFNFMSLGKAGLKYSLILGGPCKGNNDMKQVYLLKKGTKRRSKMRGLFFLQIGPDTFPNKNSATIQVRFFFLPIFFLH